jgi:hypothetical protein
MADSPDQPSPRAFVAETLDFVWHSSDVDRDDPPPDLSFCRDLASDMDDNQAAAALYADTVIDKVAATSVLLGACADAADCVGAVDYDETTPALKAVTRAWQRTADVLEPWDRRGTKLRSLAYQLRATMAGSEYNDEASTDLICMAAFEHDIVDLAFERDVWCKEGREEAWWEENGERADYIVLARAGLVADLAQRGEDYDPAGLPRWFSPGDGT